MISFYWENSSDCGSHLSDNVKSAHESKAQGQDGEQKQKGLKVDGGGPAARSASEVKHGLHGRPGSAWRGGSGHDVDGDLAEGFLGLLVVLLAADGFGNDGHGGNFRLDVCKTKTCLEFGFQDKRGFSKEQTRWGPLLIL